MEKIRTRDFIYTEDGLYFVSTNYIHPEDRLISVLKYIPDPEGDREKNGNRYRKVSSDEAYNYIREKHPEYLYFSEDTKEEMMGVPKRKVKQIIRPEERLKELREQYHEGKELRNPEILSKLMDVTDFFYYIAGIPYENLGIAGSILPGLQKSDVSDIDFVVYGLDNHRKAIKAFKENKGKEVEIPEVNKTITLEGFPDEYWDTLFTKKMKDSGLTKEEFRWYENRKGSLGNINGTSFDILVTRTYDEITERWGDTVYEPQGDATIECDIVSALSAFDNPSSYTITNIKLIEGVEAPITEIVSFSHTYAGEVIDGEHAIAKGKVEKVVTKNTEDSYRLVVGESVNGYLKLKPSPC